MRPATIRTLPILAALALLAAFIPAARAADPGAAAEPGATTKPAADPASPGAERITGEFVKWQDQDLIVLVDTNGVKKEVTLKVSGELAITLNGKTAKREDLKEQMAVVVTPADGLVTKIEAKASATAAKSGQGDDDDDEHEGGHKRGGRERHDD